MRAGTKSVLFTVVHPVPNKPGTAALGATSNRVLKEYVEKEKKELPWTFRDWPELTGRPCYSPVGHKKCHRIPTSDKVTSRP